MNNSNKHKTLEEQQLDKFFDQWLEEFIDASSKGGGDDLAVAFNMLWGKVKDQGRRIGWLESKINNNEETTNNDR